MAKANTSKIKIKSLCENLEQALSDFDNTIAEKTEQKKILQEKKPEIDDTFKKLKHLLSELS